MKITDFKEGDKFRRAAWDTGCYVIIHKRNFIAHYSDSTIGHYSLTYEDTLANDWIFYTESMQAMKIKILSEHGYEEALLGLSLNKNQPIEKMPEVAKKLAKLDYGHSKFLESIMVWLDVTAPRYWWCQSDTYRIASKQSQSTMHTILKQELTLEDFAPGIDQDTVNRLNSMIAEGNLDKVKANLPEAFLQRRIWCLSYKTIQNIVRQRKTHKLQEWKEFCKYMLENLQHPEFLV